jgi:phosphoenolpyruvate carboxylase
MGYAAAHEVSMPPSLPAESVLPPNLRLLVRESGRLLGEVIEREAGASLYRTIEDLRSAMAGLRDKSAPEVSEELRAQLKKLRKLGKEDRRTVARAFTLFLELMNACENAYRSFRLKEKVKGAQGNGQGPDSLVYVLTAHPTEARSPQNIEIFQRAQSLLTSVLEREIPLPLWRNALVHELELAWRAFPTRERVPRVKDEADHIYQTALRPGVLRSLLAASGEVVPVYLRTWVGGDKDGHPGVDEKAMRESLQLSREALLAFALSILAETERTLELIPGSPLRAELKRAKSALNALRRISVGDGKRILAAKGAFLRLCAAYEKHVHALHPSLLEGKRLFHVFPALVVPLELRESSDVLMGQKKGGKLAIERMLAGLAQFARGGSALWYARGFIVSMTESVEHLARAEQMVRAAFGASALPVIPLFETTESLGRSVEIVRGMVDHPKIGAALRGPWKSTLEIMVGYSDSSKQGGALASRVAIARAMHALEKECAALGVRPVFFQGSGGSVDRGGGSVADQLAWWPRSALRTYKVTIQGEMVERSLSSPEIARGQIERIALSAAEGLSKAPRAPESSALFRLAELTSAKYRSMIQDPGFLQLVGRATPYEHLSALKIGSRPSRRTKEISVAGLRAIPWVLCWTQTRVLFQTWWGVGSAWREMSERERAELAHAFRGEPVFTSYVKALAFTLAKVELPLWRIYLDESGLDPALAKRYYELFSDELAAAAEMVRSLSGSENPLWFKPWLGASIRLRSPIIHPLNLLQVLALESQDPVLFRASATGISAGMMTTG